MAKQQPQFVDLVLSEAKGSMFKRARGEYGVCSLTKNKSQSIINLRIPASMQEKIVSAYQKGKIVRIFA